MSKELIAEFLSRYQREYDYYREVASVVGQLLDAKLKTTGVHALVTYRAKSPDSLENKLLKRDKNDPYESIDAIYGDIVDFAAVRVALYFPAERGEVGKIIKSTFEVLEEFDFPKEGEPKKSFAGYTKKFDGYSASHFRVRLNSNRLSEGQQRYAATRVEIQVASVLMHAWSEVEHDLIYKPTSGNLSVSEYSFLDELNGLVVQGEIILERIQSAIKARVIVEGSQLSNQYELSAFLFERFKAHLNTSEPDAILGNVQALFVVLDKIGKNKRNDLIPYFERLMVPDPSLPIAEQLIDLLIHDDPDLAVSYKQEKRKQVSLTFEESPKGNPELVQMVGEFLRHWAILECVIRKSYPNGNGSVAKWMRALSSEQFRYLSELQYVRRVRNNIVHGLEPPNLNQMKEVTDLLQSLMKAFGSSDQAFESAYKDCSNML